MAKYVFISYSRSDEDYVRQLKTHLATAGVESFVDRDTNFGQPWTKVIQHAIDNCAALLVVMTSAADDSEWIHREIQWARSKFKPIIPLLLEGEPFFILQTEQYVDVRDSKMPSEKLVELLHSYLGDKEFRKSVESNVEEHSRASVEITKSDEQGVDKFILNCTFSMRQEMDWWYQDAIRAGAIRWSRIQKSKDLRALWWKIYDQGITGACVGFATAGMLEWHFTQAGLLMKADRLSPRFIWMANKETDQLDSYPKTFIESAGTQIKQALAVTRKYGCVLEEDLPMNGGSSDLSPNAFYSKAARFRIASYYNLGRDIDAWRRWIANQGPVLTRLEVDKTWDHASMNQGVLDKYQPESGRGGHAVSLVGYNEEHFIVRNSWGTEWGDRGFAYALNSYAEGAFTEAYGVVLTTPMIHSGQQPNGS